MTRFPFWLQILLIATLISACSKSEPKFQSTDITDGTFSADFKMSDQTGTPRSLSDFKGKVVAMFFGFTHCPDVCPTTLSELKSALAQLGPAAAKDVQVIFVTVDPERDTEQILTNYLGAFDPSFLGLRGTPVELQAPAKQLRIFYQRSEGKDGNYSVDHSTPTYIFDREGRARLFVSHGAGAKVFAHDIAILLDQK
jgi:protein SCO1/2